MYAYTTHSSNRSSRFFYEQLVTSYIIFSVSTMGTGTQVFGYFGYFTIDIIDMSFHDEVYTGLIRLLFQFSQPELKEKYVQSYGAHSIFHSKAT